MLSLILEPVLIPLGLGLLFGLLAPRLGRAQALVFGLALLGIYALLEGFPGLPPTAGKQKLTYVLALGVLVAHLPRPRLVIPAFLVLAALWLGWPKLSKGLPDLALIFVLAPALAYALRATPEEESPAFLWPAVVMVFAIGAAVLSVLGVFVGFGQAMGAEAALLGGALAVVWLRGLGAGPALAPETQRLALICVIASSFMVALFAPDINLPAYGLLSLSLAVPVLNLRFDGLPAAVRPFAFAALAAVPAGLAVALALVVAPAAS